MTWDGDRYQQRFDDLAAAGAHVHGEADFVMALGPASVLDAGCGTGRVAIELARRGVEVVGIDRDASMVATARASGPRARVDGRGRRPVDGGRVFDVVVMAGNVPLFTPEGTRAALVAGCARHLRAGGALVTGFELRDGYPATPTTATARRPAWCPTGGGRPGTGTRSRGTAPTW